MTEQNNFNRGFIKYFIVSAIALVLAVIVVIVALIYYKGQTQEKENQLLSQINSAKISYVAIPADENSASIFEPLANSPLLKSKDDIAFLNKYFTNFSKSNLPPLAESKNILAKYKDVLPVFENGVDKGYYQCSIYMGDQQCNVTGTFLDVSRLAALNSFVLMEGGKTNDAQQYALKISKFGRMVTANAYDMISLIVGWTVQKTGYQMVVFTGANSQITQADTTVFIQNLRAEHKNVIQSQYTNYIEDVDYLTNENNKTPKADLDTLKQFDEWRTEANPTTWDPDIVKNWFYNSLQISLSNIDLPCGSTYKTSKIDVGFNIKDTDKTENYLSKMVYENMYAGLDNYNEKRCEVENIIKSL